MKAALLASLAIALAAEHPAAACTLAVGTSPQEFYRARLAEIRRAPFVVEGYVEPIKHQAGRPTPQPVARLIVRKTFKGPRRASYPLNYVPTTCHVPFPTDRSKRQKVYLYGMNGSFHIFHVEPLK